jgi:hypothetical protein
MLYIYFKIKSQFCQHSRVQLYGPSTEAGHREVRCLLWVGLAACKCLLYALLLGTATSQHSKAWVCELDFFPTKGPLQEWDSKKQRGRYQTQQCEQRMTQMNQQNVGEERDRERERECVSTRSSLYKLLILWTAVFWKRLWTTSRLNVASVFASAVDKQVVKSVMKRTACLRVEMIRC